MKLIVGLGNPGKEYDFTRHNIGFMVIDNFAKSHNINITKEKLNGLYEKFEYNNETIILLKPLSFMNLSGSVVSKYVAYYKIDPKDILVISDDLDMPFGKIKLKLFGSSGGHNGLKNIIDCLNSKNFKRFKIGIDNDKTIDSKNYVLGKLSKEELRKITDILPLTESILNDYLMMSFDKLMNKYNKK